MFNNGMSPGQIAQKETLNGVAVKEVYLGCSSAGRPILPSRFGLLQHVTWQKWGALHYTSSNAPVQRHVGLEDLLQGLCIQL